MLNLQLREGSVAWADLEQFTHRETIRWLDVEEYNALEIGRDARDRGLRREAAAAYIRAEACAVVRGLVKRARGKKIFDLHAELGIIQQRLTPPEEPAS